MTGLYTGFFVKQVIGPEALRDYLLEAVSGTAESLAGATCGEAVLDPESTGGLGITTSADALNNRKITVTGNKRAISNDGGLMLCGDTSSDLTYTNGAYSIKYHDDAWFEDIPYENDSGTTYYVYVTRGSFPVDIGIASNLGRGYSVWASATGFVVTPNSVTLSSGKVILKLDAALTSLGIQHWLTTNTENVSWSMDCVVWMNTDTSGVVIPSDDPSVSIVPAKLTKDAASGAWRVDITAIGDGKLGQTTASTTAADYSVMVFGPVITDSSSFSADDAYVFIGTVLSGVTETVDTSGQPVTVPYATYASGFAVEHNSTTGDPDLGRHKSVTAEAGTDLDIMVDDAGDKLITLGNRGAGTATVVIEDVLQVTAIEQDANITIDLAGVTDHHIFIKNSDTGVAHLVMYGDIEVSKTEGGTGDVTVHGFYKVDSTDQQHADFDALTIMEAAYHSAFGTGTILYGGGGGASVNFVSVDAAIAGQLTMLVRCRPPVGFVLDHLRVHYMMDAAGTPLIRVAVGRWIEGTVLFTNETGFLSCTTATGLFVTQTLTPASPVLMTADVDDAWYIVIEITNNGIGNNTAQLHKVSLFGLMDEMPAFVS